MNGDFPAALTHALLQAYEAQIEALIPAADRFCAAIDTRASAGQIDFLRQVEMTLPELYLRIIQLPDPVDWFDDEDEDVPWEESEITRLVNAEIEQARISLDEEMQLAREIRDLLGDFDSYREGSDPFAETGPWANTLGDDLSSLYRQLRTYIPLVTSGHPPSIREGLWNIRHDFDYHTGKHLVEALRAIHCLLRWDRSSWDDDAWDAGIIKRSEPQQ